MAKYAVCNKCGNLYEYIPEVKFEGGTTYRIVTCDKCGDIKKETINHIHYGNDGKK